MNVFCFSESEILFNKIKEGKELLLWFEKFLPKMKRKFLTEFQRLILFYFNYLLEGKFCVFRGISTQRCLPNM